MKLLRRIISKAFHIFHQNMAKLFIIRGKVLMLHWVGDELQDDMTEPYRLSTEQCMKLLQWLNKKNTIRLENWEREDDFYALTIDDVPENFYLNAYPLLKKTNIPFTLFVNLSLLDKEGYITTSQLKEMSKCKLCTIGSHGISHHEYASLSKQQALLDLLKSKNELERLSGRSVEMYAFPYGSLYACGYMYKHLAAKFYKYAFGTIACPITKPSLLKNYYLPRINADVRFVNNL